MQKIIVLATRNAHKVSELQAMLGRDLLGWQFEAASRYMGDASWEETGETFVDNARIKAQFVAQFCKGQLVLADDSGLEVDALNGAPGVYSSSFGGMEGNHAANNQRLMSELQGKANRRAQFVCQLLLLEPSGKEHLFRGTCRGEIIQDLKGAGGFGYDPLFVPEGHDRTFAELGDETKNQLSHRNHAFAKLREALLSWK